MCWLSVKIKQFCELEIFNSIKLRKDLSFLPFHIPSAAEMKKNI